MNSVYGSTPCNQGLNHIRLYPTEIIPEAKCKVMIVKASTNENDETPDDDLFLII